MTNPLAPFKTNSYMPLEKQLKLETVLESALDEVFGHHCDDS